MGKGMNPAQFKDARHKLGLSQREMGKALGDDLGGYAVRTVASWESGEREIPPAVRKVVYLLLAIKAGG